jgi:hypothetical protein
MVALRRTIVAAIAIVVLAVAAARVGEPDRSEGRALSTIRAITSAGDAPVAAAAVTRDHDGYRFAFHEHPDLTPEQGVRPSRNSFTIVAVPMQVSGTRRRAFCADDRRIIFVTEPVITPRVERGRCVDSSRPLGR